MLLVVTVNIKQPHAVHHILNADSSGTIWSLESEWIFLFVDRFEFAWLVCVQTATIMPGAPSQYMSLIKCIA